MKHIFVINPSAGKVDATQSIRSKIEVLGKEIDYDIYQTKGPGDATIFVRKWCEGHPGEKVRFYACGGDGTLNEVVSGVVGHPEAEITVHASGSGNDYIKYYGTADDFQDLGRLVEGRPHRVDVMRVNERYSINVCNFGFDAMVCKTMNDVRRMPVIGGNNAYTTGIVRQIFSSRRYRCHIVVDGEEFYDGDLLLCTLSNGQYVGGNYKCGPLSVNDDGLLEVNLFRPMSVLRLATLIGSYTTGEHINRPAAQRLMKYRRGRVIDIESPVPLYLSVDGELICTDRYHIENLNQAVTFVSPAEK